MHMLHFEQKLKYGVEYPFKCRAHWHTCYLVIHVHLGVDDPKTCPVETSVQLPTSSSGVEKQSMSSTEEKPGK